MLRLVICAAHTWLHRQNYTCSSWKLYVTQRKFWGIQYRNFRLSSGV